MDVHSKGEQDTAGSTVVNPTMTGSGAGPLTVLVWGRGSRAIRGMTVERLHMRAQWGAPGVGVDVRRG
jgi:hypothetical protein